MPNIRFVTQVDQTSDKWALDCFVSPDDDTGGELINYRLKQIKDFRNATEPGLYFALDGLLDRIAPGSDIPRTEVRLTLATFKNDKRKCYSLRSSDEYPDESPETEIWKLVNAIYEAKLKGAGLSQ